MTQDFKPSFAEPSDAQSPLQKFTGVLKEYNPEERESNGRTWMSIKFDFTDIEVIRSTEPYPHPIASFSVSYSDRANTRWAALTASARKILPNPDPDLLVGKRQTWELLPAQVRALNNETNEWENMSRNCWQLVSVEGYGSSEAETGGGLMDKLVDMADGKTETEFNTAVFNDSEIRQMPGFSQAVESITQRQFFPMMVESGKLVQETDGRYKKVG